MIAGKRTIQCDRPCLGDRVKTRYRHVQLRCGRGGDVEDDVERVRIGVLIGGQDRGAQRSGGQSSRRSRSPRTAAMPAAAVIRASRARAPRGMPVRSGGPTSCGGVTGETSAWLILRVSQQAWAFRGARRTDRKSRPSGLGRSFPRREARTSRRCWKKPRTVRGHWFPDPAEFQFPERRVG